ncbi:LytR family transcriptional attenuator [Streptomyces sp. Amel2xB2]|uniref:LCP family protein n=1 Tax=Streptomyces sp. Amel2xB2 TaxID=1305829 RepID=UPI000DC03C83|nr:LCP family protein [Streptomyces sp. Amel2xB2]RAJ62596.1 LytR family transcriptional attenuator [Streptomyces sp. Amel2xB2]
MTDSGSDDGRAAHGTATQGTATQGTAPRGVPPRGTSVPGVRPGAPHPARRKPGRQAAPEAPGRRGAPEAPGRQAAPGGPGRPGGRERGRPAGPREPRRRHRHRWLRLASLAASLLVLGAAGIGWTLYHSLDGNIRTDVGTARTLRHYEAQRPQHPPGEAQNVLLLGSDSRRGGNGAYGRDQGGQRSDTAILLNISADRRSATGVSLPRDLMVTVPACAGRDGARMPARFAQFNSAFQTGGAACTIRTVETLTGLRVDHHVVVDFTGFKSLVDTVGGVEVCLPGAVSDRDAKLELPAGRQTLDGEDALGYVRARHGLGNGSDTDRMHRQQQFLGSLVKKVRSNGVLLNPAKLYPVLHEATSALTADKGMDSLGELYELARGMRNIDEGRVRFLTVPRQAYRFDRNRDELVQPAAGRLFTRLRQDRDVQVGAQAATDDAKSADGTAGATPEAPVSPGQGGRNQATGDAVTPSVREGQGSPAPHGGTGPHERAPVYRGTTAARDVCRA